MRTKYSPGIGLSVTATQKDVVVPRCGNEGAIQLELRSGKTPTSGKPGQKWGTHARVGPTPVWGTRCLSLNCNSAHSPRSLNVTKIPNVFMCNHSPSRSHDQI